MSIDEASVVRSDSGDVDMHADPKGASAEDTLTKGRLTYLPSLSVTMSNFFADESKDYMIGDYSLTWWRDDSILAKYPYMLINPVAWALGSQGVDDDVTDKLGVDLDDQFVFVDSGGFQIKSFDEAMMTSSRDLHNFEKLRVHPERLLEWQVTNGTAGAVLDIPPFTADTTKTVVEGVAEDSYEEWYESAFVGSLEESADIANMMFEHKREIGADEFSLYGVIHGMPESQSEKPHQSILEWYRRMQSAGDFDGMGMGVSSQNLGKTAMRLGFVSEFVEEDHIHLLGTSSLPQRALIDFFSMCNPEFSVTTDSTAFTVGGKYRQMLNPLVPNREFIVSQREEIESSEPVTTEFYPCRCVVCSRVKEVYGEPNWYLSDVNTRISTAMNMHNLNILLQQHQTMAGFIHSIGRDIVERYSHSDGVQEGSKFWRMMEQLFSEPKVKQIYDGMRFIKCATDKGLDEATSKFSVYNRFETGPGGRMIAPQTSNSYMAW